MSVTLDVLSLGGGNHWFSGTNLNAGTPVTTANFINITAGATFLAVAIVISDSISAIDPLTCHWDSAGTNQSMTQIGSAVELPGASRAIYTFGLVNPTSGSKSLQFNSGGIIGSDVWEAYGASWNGTVTTSVAAATEGYATNNASTGNNTVTTGVSIPTGDAVQASHCDATVITAVNLTSIGIDSTQLDVAANRTSGAGATVTATATQTSSTEWCSSIFGLVASAAGQTPYQPYFQQMLASKRRSTIGWREGYDHRWRRWHRERGLILPNKTIIRRAA